MYIYISINRFVITLIQIVMMAFGITLPIIGGIMTLSVDVKWWIRALGIIVVLVGFSIDALVFSVL